MRTFVLTWARWAALTAVVAVTGGVVARAMPAAVAPADGGVVFTLVITAAAAVVCFWLLRGEESYLTRELRAARTGTPVQRDLAIRRRRGAPFWSRWLSPTLGTTALLLADGDLAAARDRFDANPLIFRSGRIARLAAVVAADMERGRGGAEALEDAIARLVTMDPLAHAEAERYRVHVLVKAVLEQGDVAFARGLADDLATHPDEEARVYVVWLRAWFDLDHLAPPSEADVRRAILLARAHGADDLVAKLGPAARAPGTDRGAGTTPI